MAVSLTKIPDGKLVATDTLANSERVKCPVCEQEFLPECSDGEWNRESVCRASSARRDTERNQIAFSPRF